MGALFRGRWTIGRAARLMVFSFVLIVCLPALRIQWEFHAEQSAIAQLKVPGGTISHHSLLSRVPELVMPDWAKQYFRRAFTLQATFATPEEGASLGALNRLEYLHLSGKGVSDDVLQRIASESPLRQVVIRNAPVSTRGVASLERFQTLDELSLMACSKLEGALPKIPPNVRTLTMLSVPPALNDLSALGASKSLDSLTVTFEDSAEIEFAWIAECPQVAFVTLDNARLNQESINALGQLKDLESLRLVKCEIGHLDLAPLSKLESLKSLWLDWSDVRDDQMRNLASLPTLETLGLQNTGLTDAALKHIGAMRSLKEVNVRFAARLTQDGISEFTMRRPNVWLYSN